MAKKKKVKKPYRKENLHHLLFPEDTCAAPVVEDATIEEINQAIWDWQIIADIELNAAKNGFSYFNKENLAMARREIQTLKLQKREILATAI